MIGSQIPGDTGAALRGTLEGLISQAQGIGDRWRITEGPYPLSSSPVCLLLQYKQSTNWQTVRVFNPDGTDAQSAIAVAQRPGALNILNATVTVIDFPTILSDTQKGIVPGSGPGAVGPGTWKYVCQAAGWYDLKAGVRFGTTPNPVIDALMSVYRNGQDYTRIARQGFVAAANWYPGLTGSCHIQLAVGDYVQIGVYQSSGGTAVLESYGPANYFSIARLNGVSDVLPPPTNTLLYSPPWVDATLLNSWVAYGSGFASPGYYRDAAGIVHLKGFVRNGTVGAAVFVLPVGYRPAAILSFVVNAAGVPGYVNIDGTGSVAPFNNTGSNVVTYVSLDGISFRAEQ